MSFELVLCRLLALCSMVESIYGVVVVALVVVVTIWVFVVVLDIYILKLAIQRLLLYNGLRCSV